MPFTAGLFGTHVGRSAGRVSFLSLFPFPQCDPKVGQIWTILPIEQNIGGFDIAMNQPPGVRIIECVGNLFNNAKGQNAIRTITFHPDGEIASIHQF